MQRVKKFHETRHVFQRAAERGLSIDDMKQIVNYHDSKVQQTKGGHGGMVYRLKKTVDKKTHIVIAEIKKDECWLVSGWVQ